MWLQRVTKYLLEHRWLALAVTFFCTFVPILGALSILFAALITLRKGIFEGALFTLAATLPYLVSTVTTGQQPAGPGSLLLWAALGVILASNFTTWLITVLVRNRVSLNSILQGSALAGMLLVSIVHLAYPEVDQWWASQLTNYFNQSAQLMTKLQGQPVAPASQAEVVNIFKEYATGFAIAAVLLNAFVQVTIAIWWQNIVFNAGFVRKELLTLRMSRLMGMFFVGGFFLAYWGNRVGLDIMPILYLVFCITGLSLLHFVLTVTKASGWWLIISYFILIWAFPFSAFFLALMALLDIGFDFRRLMKVR